MLGLLLEKVEGDSDIVNCRSGNGGLTPLHAVAGSCGSAKQVQCVRVLLKYNADISIADHYGKTAKQTAEQCAKSNISRILRSAG